MARIRKKARALIAATYPHNLPLVSFAILGLATTGLMSLFNIVHVSVLAWFPMMTGYVINIIGDWKNDELNNKNLFIHRNVKREGLVAFYAVLVVVSFMLTIGTNIYLQLAVLIEILLGVIYSVGPRLRNVFIVNYINLALIYGVVPPLIGIFYVTPEMTQTQFVVILLAALFTFFSSQIKDFEDVKGDAKSSTLAQINAGRSKKIYLFYHVVFFMTLLISIMLSLLPIAFLIVFASVPFYALFFLKFMKAGTSQEYRKVHLMDNLLALMVILLFIASLLL